MYKDKRIERLFFLSEMVDQHEPGKSLNNHRSVQDRQEERYVFKVSEHLFRGT